MDPNADPHRRPVYHRLDLTAEEFAAHKALAAELAAARARVAELEAENARLRAMTDTPTAPDEHEGDWQNLGEQGDRRYLSNDQVVYRSRSGTFQAGWLPGIYADEAAAVEALRLAQTDAWPALAEMVHWSQRGQGDDYRPVTLAELAALDAAPGGQTERLRAVADAEGAALPTQGRTVMDHVVTPERQEALAAALEEAAVRVRQCCPSGFELDVEDDVDRIHVSDWETIPGMRSPLRRVFRIEW